jgi:hypothetical protein
MLFEKLMLDTEMGNIFCKQIFRSLEILRVLIFIKDG